MVTTGHRFVDQTGLRARLALALSDLYGREVPAYTTLVEVSQRVNREAVAEHGADAEELGTIERVTAERHGAIRVGTPAEMSQVARVLGAAGMHPTGFYDLRDAKPEPVPVISTAFRPSSRDELAANPFRVFTSMLVVDDRRFFDADTERALREFLGGRRLFDDELLSLADRAIADGGLVPDDAQRYLELARHAFALSPEPVDRAWYERLQAISGVAADIGGVTTTHINHLTPRVLDIDSLYAQMEAEGITMIDRIQGPPRWDGPDVLLRQTSFRALSEPRRFRETDGSVGTGELRVRFGEVEARGVALTPSGRELYDDVVADVDRTAQESGDDRDVVAPRVWNARMPASALDLAERDLAYYTVSPVADRPRDDRTPDGGLRELVDAGWVELRPIVYEDFLPRSAAGIFASNLDDSGTTHAESEAAQRDVDWLAAEAGLEIVDPYAGYETERADAALTTARELGVDPDRLAPTTTSAPSEPRS